MVALASNLTTKHEFECVLTEKFTTDPIEGQFDWGIK